MTKFKSDIMLKNAKNAKFCLAFHTLPVIIDPLNIVHPVCHACASHTKDLCLTQEKIVGDT